MKANEFSKQVPASGFFSRLLGQRGSSFALGLSIGPDSVEEVPSELAAAKAAIVEWARKRDRKDFILVTVFAEQPVCDAIESEMTKLCREDPEVAPLLRGLPVEFSFDGKDKKVI